MNMNIYDKLSLFLVIFVTLIMGLSMVNISEYRREVHSIAYDMVSLNERIDALEKRHKINGR